MWVGEMMEGASAIDHVEGFVGEWQSFRVGLLQQDVANPLSVKPLSAEVEQGRGEIDSDDLAYALSHRFGRMGGATGHVKGDHLLVERTDPRQRARSAGKGRFRS